MITCMGQSCTFSLLCVSIVKVYQGFSSFPVDFEDGILDSIVLSTDQCL